MNDPVHGNSFPCPLCNKATCVTDSRPAGKVDGLTAIRRRRECKTCFHRFTTFESEIGSLKLSLRYQALKRKLLAIAETIKKLTEG